MQNMMLRRVPGWMAGLALLLGVTATTIATDANAYRLIEIGNRFTAWIGPDIPVPWQLNTTLNDGTIDDEFEILRGSFDIWEDHVANLNISFVEGVNTTLCGLVQNGVNHLSMQDCNSQCTGSCLAVTSTILFQFGDGFWNINTVAGNDSLLLARVESDITWSRARVWEDYRDWPNGCVGFDLWGVSVHEMGHFIGLQHSQFGAATMFASVGNCDSTKASLHPDDKQGARTLYGPGARVAASTLLAGNASLTVTNKGNVAYTGSGGKIGSSFQWGGLGSTEHIFEASFALASVGGAVSNNFRQENTADAGGDADFQQTSELFVDTNGTIADQEADATFDDSRAEAPYGVDVVVRYFADDAAAREDFVIAEYQMTNNSGGTINNLRGGLFIDADFNGGSFAQNIVNYDAANDMAYVSTNDTAALFGVAVCNAEGAAAMRALFATDNSPAEAYSDANKEAWMGGGFARTTLGPADIALMINTGDFDLANGETGCAAFALIGGSNLADLQANAQEAQDYYQTEIKGDPADVGDHGFPVVPLALEQNSPNPFQRKTQLSYTVLSSGPVQLDIVDASGRRVSSLVDQVQAKGQYQVVWDGTDGEGSALPAGVYFSRFRSADQEQTRKMHLIK